MRLAVACVLALTVSPALATTYGTKSTCDLLRRGVPPTELAGTENFYLDDSRIMPPRYRCTLAKPVGDIYTATCDFGPPQHYMITRSKHAATVTYADAPNEPAATFTLHRCR